MSENHVRKDQRSLHWRSPKVFWTALGVVIVFSILLGILIIWLLMTQDLTKVTSIVGLIAGIVAILVGPLTLLFTVLRWPERDTRESVINSSPHVHPFIAPTRDTGTSQIAMTSQPVSEQPETTSNNKAPKRRTVSISQGKEATQMDTKKQFDVFLSYSSTDKTWVTALNDALESRGLKVWLDHDEIRPGDLFVEALERGLEESNAVVLVVSPEAIASGWVKEEYSRALSFAHSKNQPLRLIPLFLRDVPDLEQLGFLENRHRVDFRDASSFDKSLEQLIWGITDKKTLDETRPVISEIFHIGSALPSDSPSYIKREADRKTLLYLRKVEMDYISIIEPRQQGKTSLINQLKSNSRLLSQGYIFIICNLNNDKFNKNSEEEWYRSLSTWILKGLNFIDPNDHITLPTQSTSWETFLIDIAKAAKETKHRVVIVLDEIREIPSTFATPFFTVIRSIYSEQEIPPSLRNYLTFIISGAFDPDELIQNKNISPFNVARRIYLEDFDLSQVKQLVNHLSFPDNVTDTVAKRIFYWTDGQPSFTQKLCLLLSEESELDQFEELSGIVNRMARQIYNDESYMRRIKRFSENEKELFKYVQKIANQRLEFNPALNNSQFRLAYVHGLIKADGGRCRIRNRICEQALKKVSTYIID